MAVIPIVLSALATAGMALQGGSDCLRLSHAGTQVQGVVRICAGRYRIPDPEERGVVIIASSGTHLDMTGVTLESGDSLTSAFVGMGIVSRGVDDVQIHGGIVRGYRYGVLLEGGSGHRVSDMTLSGSRSQSLRSTTSEFDEADWLDIFQPDTFETYGSGVLFKWTDRASVTRIVATRAQNGIGLFGARRSHVADNDVSGNSGWGIHLWRASHNVIARNEAHHNVRCETRSYSRGCDSAAILLRERSDSNVIVGNNLRYSGDGFFLSGHRPLVNPSVGNLVIRNDASFAYHNAFESTFSSENVFLDNVADSSLYGFWLGYSSHTVVRDNRMIGTSAAGIAIEHGSDNTIAANSIIGGDVGVRLFAPHQGDEPSRGYRIDDNVLADLQRGIVLERTIQTRIRGNLLDGIGEGLVVDSIGRDTEVTGNVFLRAGRWFISAPDLDAGGNFWGLGSAEETARLMDGRITLNPWRSAADAGF
jgi:parallel beta-helix repeat protein